MRPRVTKQCWHKVFGLHGSEAGERGSLHSTEERDLEAEERLEKEIVCTTKSAEEIPIG